MRALRRIFDFYLDASVHVALAIFALIKISEYNFNIFGNAHLGWFLFFGSISCYNFIKYGLEAKKYLLVANQYHKGIQGFSIAALIFALYHAHFLSTRLWVGVFVLACLTGLYAIPILPKGKNLRSWGGLKISVVALVWAVATVVLPLLSEASTLNFDAWVETFQRFILVLILLIPFEIRDLSYDPIEIQTIPQRYGVINTKILGAIATVLFFFSTFLKNEISTIELASKATVFILLGGMLLITKRKQSKYFSAFWVEGIPIVWWVLWLGLSQLLKTYS